MVYTFLPESSLLVESGPYRVDKCGEKLYCGYFLFTCRCFPVRFQENKQKMNRLSVVVLMRE